MHLLPTLSVSVGQASSLFRLPLVLGPVANRLHRLAAGQHWQLMEIETRPSTGSHVTSPSKRSLRYLQNVLDFVCHGKLAGRTLRR